MQRCIGVLYTHENASFGDLTRVRPSYMLPYGGRYRLIDIALSNMANNDFSNVVLYCGNNMTSTLDHIGSGSAWELNRRRNGLKIFPKRATEIDNAEEIDAYYNTLDFYREAKEDVVFIVDPLRISKIDLSESYDKFINEDLDVLMFYTRQEDPEGSLINVDKVIKDEENNLLNIGTNLGRDKSFDMLLQIGFIKRDIFIRLVEESVEERNADSIKQAILNNIGKLRIGLYQSDNHVELIRDIPSFYRANMNLLNPDIYDEIFFKNGLILTKSKDEPSCLYGPHADVNNSLIANGCEINGLVDHSIIFRGVKIEAGAIVRNSIIFEKTIISENAVIVNSIIDKNSHIGNSVLVRGAISNPYTLPKHTTLE